MILISWVIENYDLLFNPGIPIPPESTEIHKIKDEDVANYPEFVFAAESIRDFLLDCDYAGYNVKFDLNILQAEFDRTKIDIDLFETKMLDAHSIWKFLSPRSLENAYAYFCPDAGPVEAHDARNDIDMTRFVLSAQIDELRKQGHEFESVSDISNLVNPNQLDPHGFFVKKDGVALFNFRQSIVVDRADSQVGYLQWMYSADFPPSTKKVIVDILNHA